MVSTVHFSVKFSSYVNPIGNCQNFELKCTLEAQKQPSCVGLSDSGNGFVVDCRTHLNLAVFKCKTFSWVARTSIEDFSYRGWNRTGSGIVDDYLSYADSLVCTSKTLSDELLTWIRATSCLLFDWLGSAMKFMGFPIHCTFRPLEETFESRLVDNRDGYGITRLNVGRDEKTHCILVFA